MTGEPSEGHPPLRLALGLQSHARLHGDGGRQLAEYARSAEEAGWDGVVIGDHVVIGPRLDRYPYPPAHFAAGDPWLEPMSVLAAAAALTTRITLATGVLVAPLRPAALLAKTAASVDAMSGGRLELGVGTGWQEEEFAALGADFARRGRDLTEAVRICRALWAGAPTDYRGPTVELAGIWCCPQPVREGYLPVLFSGGLHERNLSRICELGDGWITHPGLPLAEISRGVAVLRSRFEEAGRDPSRLQVRTRLPVARTAGGTVDAAATVRQVEAYRDAGVSDLTVWTSSLASHPGEVGDRIAEVGAAWRDQGRRAVAASER